MHPIIVTTFIFETILYHRELSFIFVKSQSPSNPALVTLIDHQKDDSRHFKLDLFFLAE